jgi:Bacterial protein of unknown function (DUF839)
MKKLILPFCLVASMMSCSDDAKKEVIEESKVVLKNYSVNEALMKALPGFETLEITTLISSDDKLAETPNFVFGAQPDGASLIKNPTGSGYILINNHEITQSVSRVYLDETLKPIKGDYLVDYNGGGMRLCSATMATPAEHGFGPIFLTAGESGAESMVHAIDPLGSTNDKSRKDRVLPALGKCSMENAVPLPKNAYPGKTVIIIGEDGGDGQVIAYISDKVGDLQNGKLYALRLVSQNPVETDIAKGNEYSVEFVELVGAKDLTGVAIAAKTKELKAISFARVEDVDYGKGSDAAGREVYFVATGVSQADKISPVPNYTMWGRLYQLSMDATNPLKGKLKMLMDGGENPGNSLVNPDNVCVTKNFVYVQEDGDSFYKETKHDGRIWQYNIATKTNTPMLEMNHQRTNAVFNAKYNTVNSSLLSSWEYGAMLDISDIIGKPNTFLVNIHPHTWQEAKFANPDGGGAALNVNKEGGQTLIVRGIAK